MRESTIPEQWGEWWFSVDVSSLFAGKFPVFFLIIVDSGRECKFLPPLFCEFFTRKIRFFWKFQRKRGKDENDTARERMAYGRWTPEQVFLGSRHFHFEDFPALSSPTFLYREPRFTERLALPENLAGSETADTTDGESTLLREEHIAVRLGLWRFLGLANLRFCTKSTSARCVADVPLYRKVLHWSLPAKDQIRRYFPERTRLAIRQVFPRGAYWLSARRTLLIPPLVFLYREPRWKRVPRGCLVLLPRTVCVCAHCPCG